MELEADNAGITEVLEKSKCSMHWRYVTLINNFNSVQHKDTTKVNLTLVNNFLYKIESCLVCLSLLCVHLDNYLLW